MPLYRARYFAKAAPFLVEDQHLDGFFYKGLESVGCRDVVQYRSLRFGVVQRPEYIQHLHETLQEYHLPCPRIFNLRLLHIEDHYRTFPRKIHALRFEAVDLNRFPTELSLSLYTWLFKYGSDPVLQNLKDGNILHPDLPWEFESMRKYILDSSTEEKIIRYKKSGLYEPVGILFFMRTVYPTLAES